MFWILLLSFIVILKFVDQYILSPLAVYLDDEKLIEHLWYGHFTIQLYGVLLMLADKCVVDSLFDH